MSISGSHDKLLLVFDYEGTLGTSVKRHYVQYVKALERIRKNLKLDNEPALQPLDRETFLDRYTNTMNVTDVLPVSRETVEGRIARALLKQEHMRIIWEYAPDDMLHEEVLPGVLHALDSLIPKAKCAMVSCTRQSESDFIAHLNRLQIVAGGRIAPQDICAVGTEGKTTQAAKSEALVNRFGEIIARQRFHGTSPIMIGDSTEDMLAALEAKIDFVGITATGKCRDCDFVEVQKAVSPQECRVALFPSVGSSECIAYLSDRCDAYNREVRSSHAR